MRTLLSFLLLCCALTGFSQNDTLAPPYQRFPTLPPLQLLLADSATKYTKADLPKKTPVIVMLFSPDCEHCQHEAEQFVANKDALKNIHIVMITTYPIYRMTEFAEKYGLTGLKNVVVAKDAYYLMPSFYGIRNYPFIALYNKKGELIQAKDGSMSVALLLELFNSSK